MDENIIAKNLLLEHTCENCLYKFELSCIYSRHGHTCVEHKYLVEGEFTLGDYVYKLKRIPPMTHTSEYGDVTFESEIQIRKNEE